MFQNELNFMPSVDFFSGGGNEKKKWVNYAESTLDYATLIITASLSICTTHLRNNSESKSNSKSYSQFKFFNSNNNPINIMSA